MKQDFSSQRGGARLKFIITLAVIGCTAYAGYLYVPVAYRAYLFRDLMQHYVDVAATQGYQPSWVADQLVKSEAEYEIPTNAVITPVARDNRVECRVQFNQPIEFPGYTYDYEFDYTARSTAFLTFK